MVVPLDAGINVERYRKLELFDGNANGRSDLFSKETIGRIRISPQRLRGSLVEGQVDACGLELR